MKLTESCVIEQQIVVETTKLGLGTPDAAGNRYGSSAQGRAGRQWQSFLINVPGSSEARLARSLLHYVRHNGNLVTQGSGSDAVTGWIVDSTSREGWQGSRARASRVRALAGARRSPSRTTRHQSP